MNGVKNLPDGDTPGTDAAIAIYGLRIEGNQTIFPMSLDAYNMQTGAANGDCFRWDRLQATTQQRTGNTQYFAFKVKPGYYVYGLTGRPLRGGFPAFELKAQQTLFIGDFVLAANDEVELIRDLSKSKSNLLSALPKLEKNIALAPYQVVDGTRLFLCMP
jgi:hypothetical protein